MKARDWQEYMEAARIARAIAQNASKGPRLFVSNSHVDTNGTDATSDVDLRPTKTVLSKQAATA